MKGTLTALLRKILNDKNASKQFQEAIIDRNKTIEFEGKTYKLTNINDK